MKCPSCPDATLVMSERQGIEIDYCPSCRGVWLDRGELDKIIERSGSDNSGRQAQPAPAPQAQPYPPQQQPGYGYGHGHHKYKRRKSWLEEIFD